MRCNEIQDLILTDYIDGQMESAQRRKIDAHLASCKACKEFYFAAQKTVEPFENAERLVPSGVIWQNIKEQLEESPRKSNVFVEFLERVRLSGFLPQPVLAVASVLMFVMILGIYSQYTKPIHSTHPQEQIEYLSYLMETPDEQESGVESDIENYFL